MISTEYKKMLLNLVVTFIGSFFAVTLAFYLHTPPSVVGYIPMQPMQESMQPPIEGQPQVDYPQMGEGQQPKSVKRHHGKKHAHKTPVGPVAPDMPVGPKP